MAPKGFAVIDFETTGFSPQHHHRVIEIGLVHVSPDGVIEREFETVLNPGRDLGPTHVHGLRGADVTHAPTFEAIADQLIEHLRGRVLVAHNARFETTFLRAELARLGIASPIDDAGALCTMKLAKSHIPGAGSKLADCCSALGIPLEDAHEALADARATALLLGEYRQMGRHDAAWWRSYSTQASKATWPKTSKSPQAEWLPRGRRISSGRVRGDEESTGRQSTPSQPDKPLAEQALDWMLPMARKRFGAQPVAIVEGVARHFLANRTSRSENDPVFDPPPAAVTEPVRRPSTAGRGRADGSLPPATRQGRCRRAHGCDDRAAGPSGTTPDRFGIRRRINRDETDSPPGCC
jgi:DNA polymerase III epsilon subunit family exonuclease